MGGTVAQKTATSTANSRVCSLMFSLACSTTAGHRATMGCIAILEKAHEIMTQAFTHCGVSASTNTTDH